LEGTGEGEGRNDAKCKSIHTRQTQTKEGTKNKHPFRDEWNGMDPFSIPYHH
jgi:hypothetical protein